MSSSIIATTSAAAVTPVTAGHSHNPTSGSNSRGVFSNSLMPLNAAQFREIHKNTWLKRLTAEGKRVTVGPKKSERSWVVFCVHDDTEAMLEGYAEPRQAPSHNPEWVVSMKDTLHISHALIPNSHEFEFVVTLSNEVVRFHAMSWDIMQEWVETLRSKLREMKILSPRENLYTKLPEVRAPLLPTRDPTSPLPAPPPVPAALVPGVERVVPQNAHPHLQENVQEANALESETTSRITTTTTSNENINNTTTPSAVPSNSSTLTSVSASVTQSVSTPIFTSMSNTLTQNLLNMLSDPMSAYSEQLNEDTSAEHDNMQLDGGENIEDDLFAGTELDPPKSEEDFLGPLLRKSSELVPESVCATTSNSVRVDILPNHRVSADQIKNLENLLHCERHIPRPQTSRSLSAGAADKSKRHILQTIPPAHTKNSNAGNEVTETNITELEVNVKSDDAPASTNTTTLADEKTNVTIIQVSTHEVSKTGTAAIEEGPPKLPIKCVAAEVFKFPETHTTASTTTVKSKQHEYKSNVQIIPSSNNTSTIQVLGQNREQLQQQQQQQQNNSASSTVGNPYTTPVKKSFQATSSSSLVATTDSHQKITTVHVAGDDVTYGTCYTPRSTSSYKCSPKLPKKTILSANTSGITNITVNNFSACPILAAGAEAEATATISGTSNADETRPSVNGIEQMSNTLHYEKIFLSTCALGTTGSVSEGNSTSGQITPISPKRNPAQRQTSVSSSCIINQKCKKEPPISLSTSSNISTVATTGDTKKCPSQNLVTNSRKDVTTQSLLPCHQMKGEVADNNCSPAVQRRRITSSPNVCAVANQALLPVERPRVLTRGLTEAVISTRPSRKDFHLLDKLTPSKTKRTQSGKNSSILVSNNNDDTPSSSTNVGGVGNLQTVHTALNRTTSEAHNMEQRKRSSSTSDAQTHRHTRGANNNEFVTGAVMGQNRASGGAALRIQQPPQPFRIVDNGIGGTSGLTAGGSIALTNLPASPASKRMTLREQQVLQLRREIMHPGGVRLQLRRKDCVGSVAWVDAFGAVWIAGWKQKEHPVLYNALHIGDQLLSIAGITISSAAEANKVIRNTNTLFIEVLVRRIPFGRGYAIRRDREGQCLGLIRDGNSATIVDVVPNSLAARHGLPPKAQSCDGSTLTFWVLTEINGRPLNLFFKENEIRDRLNSVGRDISILVQPADLITKLKKQLKSLRSYKDYLVQ